MHNKHKKMMSQYTCNSNKLHTSYIVDDVCHDDIIPIDKSGNRHILQVSLSTASALSILATTTIPSLQMLDLLIAANHHIRAISLLVLVLVLKNGSS